VKLALQTISLFRADYDADGKTDLAVYRDRKRNVLAAQPRIYWSSSGYYQLICPRPLRLWRDGKCQILPFFRVKSGICKEARKAFTGAAFGATNDKCRLFRTPSSLIIRKHIKKALFKDWTEPFLSLLYVSTITLNCCSIRCAKNSQQTVNAASYKPYCHNNGCCQWNCLLRGFP